eukprot:181505-Pelagomonas_calceolata.AAC.1
MHHLRRADRMWGGVISALELWAFLILAESCFSWAFWRDRRPIIYVAVSWTGGWMVVCLPAILAASYASSK